MVVVKKHWALVAALLVFYLMIGWTLSQVLESTSGHLIYTIDDPYIHLAIAKNLSEHGIWGVTSEGFTSSSSSMLWTLLLSFNSLIFGPSELIPFFLNLLVASLLLGVCYYFLQKHISRQWYIFLLLVGINVFTPLCPMVFTGQEHVLHTLLTIIFVYLAATKLVNQKITFSQIAPLIAIAPILVMARYEGLFTVFLVSLLLLFRKRFLEAVTMGVVSFIPIIIFGLISIASGWDFLPNSVLLKGYGLKSFDLNEILSFLSLPFLQISLHAHIIVILAGGIFSFYLLLRAKYSFWSLPVISVFIFVANTYLHMQFARVGWFYRYEAYLIGWGILVFGIVSAYLVKNFQPSYKTIWQFAITSSLIFLGVVLLFLRGQEALSLTAFASENIYEQHYQMGLFLEKFYPGARVVINDIGAISFLSDPKILDIWGLGTMETARDRQKTGSSKVAAQLVYQMAAKRQMEIAIVYDTLGENEQGFKQWTKLGQWKILNNIVCGSDTVSFYAIEPGQADKLAQNLRLFSSELPKSVIQSGAYLESH